MKLITYLNKIDVESKSADFFDIRIEDTRSTLIQFVDGEATGCFERPSLGAFIRVFNRGRWFFTSTTRIEHLDEELANLIASSQRLSIGDEVFTAPKPFPFFESLIADNGGFNFVSLAQKKALAEQYLTVLATIPLIKTSRLTYQDVFKRKAYLSSCGTSFEYDFTQGGISLLAMLADGESRFEDRHDIYASDLNGLVGRESEFISYFREAQKFVHAPTIDAGKMRVVMSPEVTGVFTHESFGHKSEADFLLIDPDSVKEWEIGKKVAVDGLSIVDCGLHNRTSGYCPVDDEGTPAQKNYLIKDGRLAGRLHSLQTSQVFHESPTGNARAIDFEYEPVVRMTSTYIEAGKLSFDELLKKCGNGVYVEGLKHGSGGSTFTIAPMRAYIIKDGELSDPVRVSVISGSLFKTLDCIEGISKDVILKSGAFGGCGKMEQWPLPVADGGPAIFVSEMLVS